MVESEKARKVRKPPQPRKKASKAPLYILIIVVVVVFTLIGIGIYYSLGQVSTNVIFAVGVIIMITIILELMLKRPAYRRELPEEEDEGEGTKQGEKDDNKATSIEIKKEES